MIPNIHFPGNEIIRLENVECAAKCQLECQKVSNCDHWTWVENVNYCWLKHAQSAVESVPERQTGPKFCGKHSILLLIHTKTNSSINYNSRGRKEEKRN